MVFIIRLSTYCLWHIVICFFRVRIEFYPNVCPGTFSSQCPHCLLTWKYAVQCLLWNHAAQCLLKCFTSVAQSCPTLGDPMNRSTPGLPVHHQLPEFTKLTSIESVMPSSHLILCRPLLLLPPVPPSIRVFSNESLFAWGGQSIGVSALAWVLPKNTQDWSPLGWTGWISLQSKGLSRVFSNTTLQKHQFFGTQLSSQSNSHIHTWPLEKP